MISRKNLAKIENTVIINNPETVDLYTCECGKNYRHKSSLYKHKKTCTLCLDTDKEKREISIEKSELKDIVCRLMNENNEIKDCLMNSFKHKIFSILLGEILSPPKFTIISFFLSVIFK